MGKKNFGKAQKKKLTTKEKKKMNHLKLIKGHEERLENFDHHVDKNKKAA